MSKSKEIVINSDNQTTRIAIVEGGELAELFIETEEHERTLGNIYVGKVRRIMPSIQAAFVDIGQKQDAFLHFSDLSETLPDWLDFISQERPEIARFAPEHGHKNKGRRRRPVRARPRKRLEDGAEDPEVELADEQSGGESRRRLIGSRNRGRRKMGQKPSGDPRRDGERQPEAEDDGRREDHGIAPESLLKRDQPILVKISKEPIANKGSRVTTDISLAGRFLVLVPMANYVAVSKKVSSFKERRRLRALAKMLLPEGFGVIVRTVAEGQNAKALDTDLRLLKEKWQAIEKRLAERPTPPAPVYEDVNMVSSIMRDLFSEDYDRIVIDDNRMFRNIKGYVQAVAPEIAPKVQFHDSKVPVFKAAGIDRAISEAFQSRVNLPSGGYLYIEQTEAMHVVDVNSGRAGRGLSQEDNSLKVNLEAAKVISKQIRLRDLGGILVIDFIDMRSERNRRKVYDAIRKEFRDDRAVTKVLPMSDFGLMQITRQRLRPSITTTFGDLQEEAEEMDRDTAVALVPGEAPQERVRARTVDPEDVTRRVHEWLDAFNRAKWKGSIRFRVHPFTAAYLSKGWLGFRLKCLLRYRLWVKLEEHVGMEPGRFRCYDETNGKEIRRPPRRGRKKGQENKDDASEDTGREVIEVESSADAGSIDNAGQRAERAPGRGRGSQQEGEESSSGRGRSQGSSRSRGKEGDDSVDARGGEGAARSRGRNSEGNRSRGRDADESRSRGRDSEGSRSRDRSTEDARSKSRDSEDSRTRGRGSDETRSKSRDSDDSRSRKADGDGSRSRRSEGSRSGRTEAARSGSKDGEQAQSEGTPTGSDAPEKKSEAASRSRGRGRGSSASATERQSDSTPVEDSALVAASLVSEDAGTESDGDAGMETPKAGAPKTRGRGKKSAASESQGKPDSDDAVASSEPVAHDPVGSEETSQETKAAAGPVRGRGRAKSRDEDADDGDSKDMDSPDAKATADTPSEPVGKKAPAVVPFRLRYSSSHKNQPEVSLSDKE